MKNWSLNSKIYFIFAILIAGGMAIAVGGLIKMGHINDALQSLANVNFKQLQKSYQVKEAFYEQLVQGKNVLIAKTPEGVSKYHKNLLEGNDKILKTITELQSMLVIEENLKDLQTFKKGYEEWFAVLMQVKDQLLAGQTEMAYELGMGKAREISNSSEEFLIAIIDRNVKATEEATIKAEQEYTSARSLVILISVVSILSGLILGTVVLRALKKSIGEVVTSLNDGSTLVTSTSEQIAFSSEELSRAATEQASSLEETSASIQEMSSMVQKNAESAKRTHELSASSTERAEKGKIVVKDMIRAIDDISHSHETIMNQVDDSNEKISEIVKVIAEIGNKTKVINDIVFQTKLLSFNASVEAARAGEHGKGFAVVAEEVGNLAQMSGKAAKEISDMLDNSIRKVEVIVTETKEKVGHLIHEGKSKIDVGTHIAQECNHVLEGIVHDISQVAEMAREISTASEEQSHGVQEITKAMNQLDQVTQTNAAASEQSATAAEELSSQASSLKSTVGVLIKEIYGSEQSVSSSVTLDRKPRQAKMQHPNNVVSLPSRPAPVSKKPRQAVAVGEIAAHIPSENDPRFEEI